MRTRIISSRLHNIIYNRIVSTAGTPATSSAAPTSNIPDIISTEQPAAEPSTTASDIPTSDPLVQPTTATSYQPLTIAPLPAPPPPGLMCKASVDPTSSEPWRLLQQNIGNGLDQSWSVYKYGFNDGTGGYWIGNENLHRMTNNGTTCQLCIDMQDKTAGSWYFAHYASFVVGNEDDGYKYTTSGFQGSIGVDTFGLSNGFNFSAKDTNTQPCENFAATLKGGWWYPCHATQIVLNGVASPPTPPGFYWTTTPINKFFKTSYMWIACP